MANTNQARKRARQADSRRDHNSKLRSSLRTEIKKFRSSLDENSADQSKLSVLQGHIDIAAKKGIISVNRARRLVQRLNSALKAKAAA
jgi:small subunit ribosomal protein S20